jgi:hypothetical protein
MGESKRKEVLRLISGYCFECEIREFCCEDECILWNIEKVVTKEE